jgi:hypothetical protein
MTPCDSAARKNSLTFEQPDSSGITVTDYM